MEKTLLANLERKRPLIDSVYLTGKGPIPSFIDLNTGEYCNRKCEFCPRYDSNIYPNQYLFMSLSLAERMVNDLSSIGFKGIINICGYGEPLAHPEICDIVRILSKIAHVEIVTNGDLIKLDLVQNLFASGLSQLSISAYDGPHQIAKYSKLMSDAKISNHLFHIRNRWFSKEEGYGLKLTNRAGLLSHENSILDVNRPCNYPHYSLSIDWNGDVLLCVQDWHKKITFGSIFKESIESIWFSKKMKNYRKKLIKGRANAGLPCTACDADGLVYGELHSEAWRNYLD